MIDSGTTETGTPTGPEFKSWIPYWAKPPKIIGASEQYRFKYVKEPLDTRIPYLGRYVKDSRSVLKGIINKGAVSYSLDSSTHSDLFDAEGEDISTINLEKTKFQIEFEYAVPHIKVHGTSAEVKSAIKFLRIAGLSPKSQISGGTWVNESWKNFFGTLGELDMETII